jgi:hypothetical protein
MDHDAESHYMSPYARSWPYIQLREPDAAMALLEQGYDFRDPGMGFAAVDPKLDPLRGNARFQALLLRMRLR